MEEKSVAKTPKAQVPEDKKVMHEFDAKTPSSNSSMKLIAVLVIVAILGIGTGYLLAGNNDSGGKSITAKLAGSSAEKGKTYGDGDPEIFKDTAEGIMKEGGIDGEGQFHLDRDGGEDQNVYLTSSLVDLSEFEGKKVKVWGQTFEGQKAGWLMDVGRLQVLE
jgi:hypothetical protein